MRLLLLLFAVCIQQLAGSGVITPDRKDLFTYQPVRGPLQSNIRILNERKLQKKVISKQLFHQKAVFTGKTKKTDKNHRNYTAFSTKKADLQHDGYTAFPPMPQSKRGIPESKYFQVFQDEEHFKPSVKKALTPLVRAKRSANNQRGHHSKKEAKRAQKVLESRRPVYEKDSEDARRRSHHKKSHKKHKKHGKKHHKSRKHKKSGHRHVNAKDTEKSDKRSTSNEQAHRKRNDTRRLYASRDATIDQFPYVVSIQKGDEHWCSGALLNPRIVVTTANCVWKSVYLSRMHVRAGSRKSDSGGQRAHIAQALKHPNWSLRKDPDNDVAMLLLDRDIKFSHAVHGVDLPNRMMTPAFDDVWVTSWGSDRRDGIYNPDRDQLQVYHARLMDRRTCNNQTRRYGVSVSENFFCVSQVGQRAPCTRDTGAPAVSDGVIWGLASWGIRKLCGTERYPAMFSYLGSPSNHDFLINATRVLMSDMRQSPYLDRFEPRGPLRVPRITTRIGQ